MRRSIWFWLSFIIAMCLAIYFSVRIITTGFGHSPSSLVRNISISADQENKDLSGLVSAINIASGTNSYLVDLEEINTRISNVPGIKKSAVRRMPNGNISVTVSLYQAVALWTDGENYYPLSADGTIVNKPTETRNIGSVVFSGKLPSDISEITKIAHNLVGHLNHLEWIENRRWDMYTNNGIRIMLPEQNPSVAVNTLVDLNNKHNLLNKDIKTIDMRDSARILIE
jgi:cell division protein FtsQ